MDPDRQIRQARGPLWYPEGACKHRVTQGMFGVSCEAGDVQDRLEGLDRGRGTEGFMKVHVFVNSKGVKSWPASVWEGQFWLCFCYRGPMHGYC